MTIQTPPHYLAAALAALPIWRPEGELFHIGSMRPEDKGVRGNSLEGHGLSVSECPDAWRAIARLGGLPTWRLDPLPASNGFLDIHQVTDTAPFVQWACENQLLEPVVVHRVTWYDSESDSNVYSEFTDIEEARREAGIDDSAPAPDEDDEEARTLTTLPGWRLTSAACERLRLTRPSTLESVEMAVLLAVEALTDVDGVYWDDELDELGLSAPRAVIFPDRIEGRFAMSAPAPAPRRRMAP